ncbi:TPA: agmatinase [Candidatus Bathyarchaeota archaeon]|nr:agmatinase [Candidatus Bathyarchaeota archaeon]
MKDDVRLPTMARLVSPVNPFAGVQAGYEEANYVVLGFPYDLTSTYRFGSRNAPHALREASLNIETYSPRTGLFLENLKIRDLGDLEVSTLEDPFKELTKVFQEVFNAGKFPVVLGGEHTLTYSTVKAMPEDVTLLFFDAHLDMRDTYEGRSFSHTTHLRRLTEEIEPSRLLIVGVRAIALEELEYVRRKGIRYITSFQISKYGFEWAVRRLEEYLGRASSLYISFDMDVLDPAYAPAASNPEPEGLNPSFTLNLLEALASRIPEVVGLDLTEFSPAYDNGVTAVLGAKMVFETLCLIEATGCRR